MARIRVRGLRTIAVAAGLIIAQGTVLAQQSSPVSANTGTQLAIFSGATLTSPGVYQAQAGTALSLSVSGAGFAHNAFVDVTFNAPMGFNTTSGQHATPPNTAVPQFETTAPAAATTTTPAQGGFEGDALEPSPAGTPAYAAGAGPRISPNGISEEVLTNAQGALIGGQTYISTVCTSIPVVSPALCPGNAAVFNIPATAAPGRYTITGVDTVPNTGSVTLILTASNTNQITVTPTAPNLYNGVGLGGGLNITIPGGTFPQGDVVQFAATDFLGVGFGSPVPSVQDTNEKFTPVPGSSAFGPGGADFLQVLSCGGSTTPEPGPTFVANATNDATVVPPGFTPAGAANTNIGTTACIAGAGALSAQVQARTDNVAFGAAGNNILTVIPTGPGAGTIAFPDGVYSLVAVAFSQQMIHTGTPNTYTYTTAAIAGQPLKFVTTGVQLDHTVTRISLSTGQSAPGDSLAVNGYGFAANSQILVWLGGQQAPAAATGTNGTVQTFPSGAGCAFALSGSAPGDGYVAGSLAGAGTCLLGTTITDGSGSFNLSATIPGAGVATTNPGVVLAEDFDGTSLGTAPYSTSPNFPHERLNASATALLNLNANTTGSGLIVSPNPAAVGSTVTFTGTGYTPFEAVAVMISDSATGCVATNVATVQAGPPITSGGPANVVGSFIVPFNACTTVDRADATANAGVTATVSAVGGQSGLVNSGNLVIPPTSTGITPAPVPPAVATTAVLTGAGFAANEPVSFQFVIASSLIVVVGQSDASGNVTVSTPIPIGVSAGPFSVRTIGLISGFSATAQTGTVPAALNVTATNLTGSGFAVTFSTSSPASAALLYGTIPGVLSSSAYDDRDGAGPPATSSTVHRFTLSGLTAGTTYYFEPVVFGIPQPAVGGNPYSQVVPSLRIIPPLPHQVTGSVLLHDGTAPPAATVLLQGYWTNPDGSRSLPVSVLNTTAGSQNLNYTIGASPLDQAGTDFFPLTVGSSVFHVSGAGDDGGQLGIGGPVSAVLGATVTKMPAFTLSPFVSFTYQLQVGWNFITLPLNPTAPLDAQTVLTDLLADTGGSYVELDNYSNGQWTPSLFDDPGDGIGIGGTNFTLQLAKGYALYSDKAGSFSVTGTPAGAQPVTLTAGWNLVGFPDLSAATPLQADSFLSGLLGQTHGGYAEIDGYSNGQFSPSAFDDPADGIGLGGSNFSVQSGQGYAVYTDTGTTQNL